VTAWNRHLAASRKEATSIHFWEAKGETPKLPHPREKHGFECEGERALGASVEKAFSKKVSESVSGKYRCQRGRKREESGRQFQGTKRASV